MRVRGCGCSTAESGALVLTPLRSLVTSFGTDEPILASGTRFRMPSLQAAIFAFCDPRCRALQKSRVKTETI